MEPIENVDAVPFARVVVLPPPVPPQSLRYTFVPDAPPRRLVRVGLFFAGLLFSTACCALALVVLMQLGKGVSIASILARLISIALAFAPLGVGRVANRRWRTEALMAGCLVPVALAAWAIVLTAIMM
jgi:hypothetical protein